MIRAAVTRLLIGLSVVVGLAAPALAEDPDHPLDAHLSESYTDDLDGLLQRKYIRVLTTYNRTNFFLARGRTRGFEYALLKEFQSALNADRSRRQLQVVFEFIPVSRDRLLPDLIEGYGDIAAAGLTITEARRNRVAFTDPYLTGVDEILVAHKNVSRPRSVTELAGRRIFVRQSSSYHDSLQQLNQTLRQQGKRPVQIVRADENLETEDILELVNSGAIGRTICDSHIADIWKQLLPDIRLHPHIRVREDGHIAWAVRKSNPKLKARLDRFIADHRKGTLLGNIFFKRYYEKTTWVKNPMGGSAGKKLGEYRALLQTYADRYGFDWRLIAAIAYQESGFDQNKTSPAGAVGIMQIRPETAADPNVGIADIQKVENNIHAAVKYLAFLRDRYFSDAAIRPRDRVRFSLAAYNAGPVKVRRARRLAGEMNLNPNRWFRNVEMAMLRIVGQETVRYVSNVNKYYVIYRSALERVEQREKAIERVAQ